MDSNSQRTFRQWDDDRFKEEILKFRGKYVDRMLKEFYLHFSETDTKGRMLFQVGKSWDTSKRLAKWRSNNYSRYDIDEAQLNQKGNGNTNSFATNPARNNANKRADANSESRAILGLQ